MQGGTVFHFVDASPQEVLTSLGRSDGTSAALSPPARDARSDPSSGYCRASAAEAWSGPDRECPNPGKSDPQPSPVTALRGHGGAASPPSRAITRRRWCSGEALLLSPIRAARPGRLGSRRRRLPHAMAFVPVYSIDGCKGIGPASMRVEDQAQVAASVDPDDLEALSLAWRVGLRLGRAGWRTFDDAKLWSHRAVRRRSIFRACEQLRDIGCRLRCRSGPSSMATRILGPWRGHSVCVLKQEVLEKPGSGVTVRLPPHYQVIAATRRRRRRAASRQPEVAHKPHAGRVAGGRL